MWQPVCNAVYNQVYSYSEHVRFVQQNRIFYGNHHNNRQYKGKKLSLSYVNVIIPTILSSLNCIRAFTVLNCSQWFDTRLIRLCFFTEIVYPSIRTSFETCVIFWTFYTALNTVYVLRCDIVRFAFFAALVFSNEPEDGITPRDLGSCLRQKLIFH